MDPALISGLVEAGGSLVSLIAKFINAPDPAAALADMRAQVAKMQADLGPGGALDLAVAAHNATLDAAISAEKAKQAEAAPNPTVLVEAPAVATVDEETKP